MGNSGDIHSTPCPTGHTNRLCQRLATRNVQKTQILIPDTQKSPPPLGRGLEPLRTIAQKNIVGSNETKKKKNTAATLQCAYNSGLLQLYATPGSQKRGTPLRGTTDPQIETLPRESDPRPGHFLSRLRRRSRATYAARPRVRYDGVRHRSQPSPKHKCPSRKQLTSDRRQR